MLKSFTREEKCWIFYDWANSAFSAIVAAIILPLFFKEIARSGGLSDVNATADRHLGPGCVERHPASRGSYR